MRAVVAVAHSGLLVDLAALVAEVLADVTVRQMALPVRMASAVVVVVRLTTPGQVAMVVMVWW